MRASQLVQQPARTGHGPSRACRQHLAAPHTSNQQCRRQQLVAGASCSGRAPEACEHQPTSSQRPLPLQRVSAGLMATLAAATLSLSAATPAVAAQPQWLLADAAAEAQMQQVLDEEQDLSEEIEQPAELEEFLKLFQKGSPTNAAKLESARLSVGFRRTADGRVQIQASTGDWFSVKPDGRAAGFLLLRDADGNCYYLPPDQAGALAQLDLSDDTIVAQLFANHMWEQLLEPLEMAGDQPGSPPQQLRLSERDFRGVLSLVEGGQALEEQPLEAEDDEAGS